MKEISVTEIKGIKIGQVEIEKAATGCTVFVSETGMHAGIDIRGGGPAARESQLLNPLMAAEEIVPTPKIWTHKDWRWKNGSKSLSCGVEGPCFERV